MNRVPERDLLSAEDSDTPKNLGGTVVAVHVVQTTTHVQWRVRFRWLRVCWWSPPLCSFNGRRVSEKRKEKHLTSRVH